VRTWKKIIIEQFARRNIYISRKYHPNDGTITKRIQQEMIRQAGGVLHIGAHEGQEAPFYNECDVPVIWIEALPNKYQFLKMFLANYPKQAAICALLGNSNTQQVDFHVSDNNAASSSIYKPIPGPDSPFMMVESIPLEMKRLDSLFSQEKIARYRHWVIDVQGAELDVLKGTGELLRHCDSLIIEAKRVSSYLGGSTWDELVVFLANAGLVPLWQIGEHDEDNAYFLRVKDRIIVRGNS
jgi:FkbM family methyltransferase